MKIIWIVPGFQSDAADRCIPALTDLAHRVAQDHSLKVFALQYPGRDDSYRVGRVRVRSFSRTGGKLARLGPLSRAMGEIWREPGDLVHAFWAAEPALVGLMGKIGHKRPLVVSCMGGEPVYLPEIGYGAAGKRLDRFYLKRAVAGATVITAGSETQASLLKKRFPKLKPVVTPLGVDLTRFHPPAPAGNPLPEKPLALAVGSLLPVKGHANLVEAVAKVPGLRLRIVGEGPERGRLEALLKKLGLAERVELAGEIDPENMPAEYAAADLLALPSYYESQCVALLEGLACGLPTVAAPVGLAPAILTDGRAGELTADNSAECLAEGIGRLLAHRNDFPRLREAAQAKAAEYSLEVCAGRTMRLYYEALIRGLKKI
jgi:glycosyltransferase involved in cell wall biosynthesis